MTCSSVGVGGVIRTLRLTANGFIFCFIYSCFFVCAGYVGSFSYRTERPRSHDGEQKYIDKERSPAHMWAGQGP